MINIESIGLKFTCNPESQGQNVAYYHVNGRAPEGVDLEGVEVERFDEQDTSIGRYKFTDGQFNKID